MKNIKYNYHCHTKRCGHAIGEDEQYVQEAIKAGYEILGFSDHAPYKTPLASERMDYNQLDEYISSINFLKEKYKNDIKILLGLEIEYYPSQIEDTIKYRKMTDYCVLGQHQQEIDGQNNYILNKPYQLYDYANSITKACSLGLIDIIVHPDVFMFSYPKWDKACIDITNQIIDTSLKYDIPIEVNCGGIKYGEKIYEDGKRYAYPNYNFFKIVAKRQCPVVLGLDVHDPKLFNDTSDKNKTIDIIKDLDLNILYEYDISMIAKKRKERFSY